MIPHTFIGLDWGTSSLRAYLFSRDGAVLEQREAAWGVLNLPTAPTSGAAADREGRFAGAFWQLLQDWLARPDTSRRVLACGMVGSTQGWREAGYLPVPVAIAEIAGTLTTVDAGNGVTLAIAPGLLQHEPAADALRGEETQIAGVPALLAQRGLDLQGRWLLGLPGTHSKWVIVQDGHIREFSTFLTGELYALLVQHSILGRSMGEAPAATDSEPAHQAFMLGVHTARGKTGRKGLLGTLFSSRALALTGRLDGPSQREYLSGLLVGHELAGVLGTQHGGSHAPRMALIGRPALCRRYHEALAATGHDAIVLSDEAGIRGLWSLISQDAARNVTTGWS